MLYFFYLNRGNEGLITILVPSFICYRPSFFSKYLSHLDIFAPCENSKSEFLKVKTRNTPIAFFPHIWFNIFIDPQEGLNPLA